jgi:hypothetical protein
MSYRPIVRDDALEPEEIFPVSLSPLASGHAAKLLAHGQWQFADVRQPNHATRANDRQWARGLGRGGFARELGQLGDVVALERALHCSKHSFASHIFVLRSGAGRRLIGLVGPLVDISSAPAGYGWEE